MPIHVQFRRVLVLYRPVLLRALTAVVAMACLGGCAAALLSKPPDKGGQARETRARNMAAALDGSATREQQERIVALKAARKATETWLAKLEKECDPASEKNVRVRSEPLATATVVFNLEMELHALKPRRYWITGRGTGEAKGYALVVADVDGYYTQSLDDPGVTDTYERIAVAAPYPKEITFSSVRGEPAVFVGFKTILGVKTRVYSLHWKSKNVEKRAELEGKWRQAKIAAQGAIDALNKLDQCPRKIEGAKYRIKEIGQQIEYAYKGW